MATTVNTFAHLYLMIIYLQAFRSSMTNLAQHGNGSAPNAPDFRRWIRTDRIESRAVQTAITEHHRAYAAWASEHGIATAYVPWVRAFLAHTAKRPADLAFQDYAEYMAYVEKTRTSNESTLNAYLTALRSHMTFTGKDDWRNLIGVPHGTRQPSVRQPLSPEHAAILAQCDDYFYRLRARARTELTARSIRVTLGDAIRILGKHPRTWTQTDGDRLLTEWQRRQLRNVSINHHVSVLRGIVRFYGRDPEHDSTVPFFEQANLRRQKPFKQWTTPAALGAILNDSENIRDPPWVPLGMRLLAFTGLRRDTICRIRMENIDLTNGAINITTKMDKTAYVPLHPEYLYPWVERAYQNSNSPYLLHQKDGTPVAPESLYHWATKLSRAATGTRFRPHDFRRGAGRMIYYASGKDLILTRDFLTHSSTKQTSEYLGLDDDELRAAFAKIAHRIKLPPILPPGTPPALQDGSNAT